MGVVDRGESLYQALACILSDRTLGPALREAHPQAHSQAATAVRAWEAGENKPDNKRCVIRWES